MAKNTPPPPDVEIHLILPVIRGLRKLGTIIAKQGNASVMQEFEYTDANDLTATIIGVTRDLTERKQQLKDAAVAAKTASVSPATSDDVTPDADTESPDGSSSDDADEPDNNAEDDLLTTISATTVVHRNDALDATNATDKRGQLSLI